MYAMEMEVETYEVALCVKRAGFMSCPERSDVLTEGVRGFPLFIQVNSTSK
jgi:hypothetical protein